MKKAQSTLEYAVAIGCLVVALVAMKGYIQRGMQGRYKQATDELGTQYALENSTAYNRVDFFSNVTVGVKDDDRGRTITNITINEETENKTELYDHYW